MRKVFICGTDTDAGKTVTAVTLIHALQQAQLKCLALKPISAGAITCGEELHNDDALALQAALTTPLAYTEINPICFAPAIAPHIAAVQAQRQVTATMLVEAVQQLEQREAQVMVVEGAGGWLVPLNHQETMADFVAAADLDVILVVGLKLGCLNHALLTVENINQRGLNLIGWVGNQAQRETMTEQAANIETLKAMIDAPCLGILPFHPNWRAASLVDHLDVNKVLQSLFTDSTDLVPAKNTQPS